MSIKVAVVGLGNCCSSLYQGVHYYRKSETHNGMMSSEIGGYTFKDIEFVVGFDVDKRKIGKCFRDALMEKPNCTLLFVNKEDMDEGPTVLKGPVLDGVASLMNDYSEDVAFRVDDSSISLSKEEICAILRERKVDILINYLPVGSQLATEFYAECCLETGVSFLNCIPVFIASDPVWEQKFIDAGIPLIGDDIRSEYGASILSQMFQELAFARGHKVKCHIQRNIGGNTDFLNMTDKNRLSSKKISKENVIKAQNRIRNVPIEKGSIHAGPSEYIEFFKDNKVANFHIEMEGFMGSPVILDAQLSVIDSPNSAGVVIEAIRYLKVAREMSLRGALRGPSASTKKSPPEQMVFSETKFECDELAARRLTDRTRIQTSWYDANELLKLRPSFNS